MSGQASSRTSASPTVEERLRHALALLSGMEWNDTPKHSNCCPVCGWPKGGHHGTRHEPGCSLEAVLTNRHAHRLLDLERLYGDAAYGYDGRDRRRHATPVVL